MTETNKPIAPDQELELDLSDQMLRRREELEALRTMGVDPFPYAFDRTDFSRDLTDSFKDDGPTRDVCIAGRLMSIRRMGKASFCHVKDAKGRIQVYLKKDDIGTAYDAFKLLDIGDLVGVKGFLFRTKMGEISIQIGRASCRERVSVPV
jgi:lysyl-tRNA synthetase, class II